MWAGTLALAEQRWRGGGTAAEPQPARAARFGLQPPRRLPEAWACPWRPPNPNPGQGSKAELQALLTADGLFGGVAKVGFDVPPASVKYKEMSWIDTVVVNGGACGADRVGSLQALGQASA